MKQYYSYEYLVTQLETKTTRQIAEENNISIKTIQRKLREFGLTKPSEKWTKKELDLIKKEYPNNLEVYKLFPSRTINSINHKASRLDLRKPHVKLKYELNNPNFFDTWTVASAYFFGWFCSDGCVSSNSNCCSFHIHVRDSYILELFKNYIGSSHPVEIRGDYAHLRIYDPFLRESLITHGCTPRKSLVLDFPDVPDKFLSHFLRGYFDGDGSIMINDPNTIKVQFLGSKQFVEKLQKLLNRILNLKLNKNRYSHIWQCLYYGKDARKLCKWMYNKCKNLYLKRKKKIFDNHLNRWHEIYGNKE